MRRRTIVVVAVVAVGLVSAAACSFPAVTFDNAADGSVDHADIPTGDGGDPTVLVDGSDPDALIVRDAGMAIDGSGCAKDECDCDQDGYRVITKAGCEGGLNDCDDFDPRSNPNQGYLVDEAGAPQFGDWNCNKTVETLYPESSDCSQIAMADCAKSAVFTTTVGCGNFGTLTHCKLVVVSCVNGTTTPQTQQACK